REIAACQNDRPRTTGLRRSIEVAWSSFSRAAAAGTALESKHRAQQGPKGGTCQHKERAACHFVARSFHGQSGGHDMIRKTILLTAVCALAACNSPEGDGDTDATATSATGTVDGVDPNAEAGFEAVAPGQYE